MYHDIFYYIKFYCFLEFWGASLVTQTEKSPPAVQETQVRSLGWEDPLEKGMVTHSRILAWGIPWTEETGGLQSMGLQESDMTEQLSLSLSLCFKYWSTACYIDWVTQ